MKKNLSVFKLVLIALWLVASLACGSQNQNSLDTSNVPANNVSAKTNKKDPKEVCAYLPEFPTGEYKTFADNYKCESNKEEKLAGGKKSVWHYEAIGTTGYIKWVEFRVFANGTVAENLKAEKRFVEALEIFWQKAFAVSLPNDFKDELLVNKGKPDSSRKSLRQPYNGAISHVTTGADNYGLQIRIDLDR